MNEPISLDSLFKEKIFRVPDYQRGYAWQKSQLKDFWEDLINLSDGRSHYTGVLTLKENNTKETKHTDNEYWLMEDHSYKIYSIVDGQQRLTTCVVLLQSFIEIIQNLDINIGKLDKDIYITDSLNLEEIIKKYLYKTKPTGDQYRTYKFGYTIDNPSYNYLRYKIFNESGEGSIKDTFYTLNLKNAKLYFYEQLKNIHSESGIGGLQDIYKKLTKQFLFNEYVIKDELDVFVAFETMNNRGKHLSDLELLKNRLIYLTTLYSNEELDSAERKSLRDAINDAWKEVYHQLGRNDKHPLNDDEFLKAHWIMYFQYSRKKGNDYIKFLLGEQFSPHKVYKKVEHKVEIELPEEHPTDSSIDDLDSDYDSTDDIANSKDYIDFVNRSSQSGAVGTTYMRAIRSLEKRIKESIFDSYSLDQLKKLKVQLSKNGALHSFNVSINNSAPGAAIGQLINFKEGINNTDTGTEATKHLIPFEVKKYVDSLKESAVHWFNSYYPYLATGLSDKEKDAIDRLNRIGIRYFRPLVISVLKHEGDIEKRIEFFNQIERFIFISFHVNQNRSNYRDSEFYNAARELSQGELTLDDIKRKLEAAISDLFNKDGTFNSKNFYDYLYKRFNNGSKGGYYGWPGLRYFLYEYEISLLQQATHKKVTWDGFLKTSGDKVSIEHIFPQTPTKNWRDVFSDVNEVDYPLYSSSIGNLLLLSMSINSSLQNDDFNEKKQPKKNDRGEKIRNGYSDGSHSEIEVARQDVWNPAKIEERGLCLLNFMERRWNIKFKNDQTKKDLLFIPIR